VSDFRQSRSWQQGILNISRLPDKNLAIEIEKPIHAGSWRRAGYDRFFGETVATTRWMPRQAPAHRLFVNVSSGWFHRRAPEQILWIAHWRQIRRRTDTASMQIV
jgi:hypothetical protein